MFRNFWLTFGNSTSFNCPQMWSLLYQKTSRGEVPIYISRLGPELQSYRFKSSI